MEVLDTMDATHMPDTGDLYCDLQEARRRVRLQAAQERGEAPHPLDTIDIEAIARAIRQWMSTEKEGDR